MDKIVSVCWRSSFFKVVVAKLKILTAPDTKPLASSGEFGWHDMLVKASFGLWKSYTCWKESKSQSLIVLSSDMDAICWWMGFNDVEMIFDRCERVMVEYDFWMMSIVPRFPYKWKYITNRKDGMVKDINYIINIKPWTWVDSIPLVKILKTIISNKSTQTGWA